MTFIELDKLLEALNIIKKTKDTNKDSFHIDKFTVKKTKHIKQIRKNDKASRDTGISDKEFQRIMGKFVHKHKPTNGEYHILFKPNNSGEKYNDLIVVVSKKEIRFKTVIQKLQSPDKYFTKKGDTKIIIEKF